MHFNFWKRAERIQVDLLPTWCTAVRFSGHASGEEEHLLDHACPGKLLDIETNRVEPLVSSSLERSIIEIKAVDIDSRSDHFTSTKSKGRLWSGP